MHGPTGPFLSSAVIRRILALHPFSEANRRYLEQEAERREQWEQAVEALLREVMPARTPTPSTAHPHQGAHSDHTRVHT